MDDKQELEYLRRWHKDDEKQYVFSYVLTLASIVTALATLMTMLNNYHISDFLIIPTILGVITIVCAVLLIIAFAVNFLGMKRS